MKIDENKIKNVLFELEKDYYELEEKFDNTIPYNKEYHDTSNVAACRFRGLLSIFSFVNNMPDDKFYLEKHIETVKDIFNRYENVNEELPSNEFLEERLKIKREYFKLYKLDKKMINEEI